MSQRRHRERGSAAVEMALVLPLFILLIGGIVDVGRAFMVTAALSNAAREGTRYATVVGDPTTAANKTAIENRALQAANDMGGSLTATTTPTAVFSYTCTTNSQMTVTVTTSFKWLMLNSLPGISNPRTMIGKSVIGCS